MPSSARPRYATCPTPGAATYQRDIFRAARFLGYEMLPWQRKAARLLGELRPDGRPRWKVVIVSIPRQSGKTVFSKAAMAAKSQRGDDLELFGTAQTRAMAARHLVNLGKSLKKAGANHPKGPKADPLMRAMVPQKVLSGAGNEHIVWKNGSIYRYISPVESGGHGESISDMLIDEGWTLTNEVLGGVMPATIARPNAQILILSTMGTFDSTTWNGLVEDARDSIDDPDSTIAYLEYSAEHDDDVFNEETWPSYMPALGITVQREDIRSAIKIMLSDPDQGPNEVVRAFGNRTVRSKVAVFPSDWIAHAWRVIEPPQSELVLAVDVNNNPPGASITAGFHTPEGIACALLDHSDGAPNWLPDKLNDYLQRYKVNAVVVDLSGPTKQLQPHLEAVCEARSVPLVNRLPADAGADVSRFYNALRENTVHLGKAEPLVSSIDGAARRSTEGGLWWISRKLMKVDASPLISTILAHGVAMELQLRPVVTSEPRLRWV